MKNKIYYVYIAECNDGTLYTGYTHDLKRRLKEHNNSDKGAKYTSGRRPVKLVYSKELKSSADAKVYEAVIKKLTRSEKLKLISKK